MKDQEVRELREQIRSLQRRLRRELPPVPGLSRTSLQVLRALGRMPDGAQPSKVADELSMASSNVAAALRDLEAAGLISRTKGSADARQVQLSITAEGTTLLATIRSERDTWLGQAIAATLNTEEKQVLLTAGKLIQRLAEYEA